MRVEPEAAGGWQVQLGRGAEQMRYGGFPSAAAATAWGDALALAMPASTFRVGRKRVLATGAEALGRWAIQQGILPRAEGGTQLAPALRLADLLADPACALPLAALGPTELAGLRARRLGAGAAVMLAEQAALAAAIAMLFELQGMTLAQPFAALAPDGWQLPAEAMCRQALAQARQESPGHAAALELLLASGAAPTELAACGPAGFNPQQQALLLPGRRVALPPGLARRAEAGLRAWQQPGFAAWLAGWRPRAAGAGPLSEGSWRLAALVRRLEGGSHLDEVFILAGESAAAAAPLVPWAGETLSPGAVAGRDS